MDLILLLVPVIHTVYLPGGSGSNDAIRSYAGDDHKLLLFPSVAAVGCDANARSTITTTKARVSMGLQQTLQLGNTVIPAILMKPHECAPPWGIDAPLRHKPASPPPTTV